MLQGACNSVHALPILKPSTLAAFESSALWRNSALPSKYTKACTSSTRGDSSRHMPFLPTLIGWSSCPMESGMKAGSPMPDSISMTCVVVGLAIAARATPVLRSVVDGRGQIDAVLVELRKAARED